MLLSTAEYQYAIVLPKKDEEARGLVHICGFLLLITTGIVLLSVPFSKPIARLFNTPELANWYWLMPLFVFVMGLWNILNYWYIRRKQFGAISRYQISQSVLSSLTKIAMGCIKNIHCGLIIGSLFGPLLPMVVNLYHATADKLLRHLQPKKNYRTLMSQYKNFPLFSFPRALLNQLGSNMPTLLLTPFFGLTEIGFFSMSITLGFRPINMLCSSIYQVMYQRLAERVINKDSIWKLLAKYIIRTGSISILFFLILFFILPDIVTFLLGEEWLTTSKYIQLMLPWLLMVILVSTTSYITDIFQRQRGYMIFEIIYVLSRLAALIIGIIYDSMYISISLFCIVSSIILLLEFIWFAHIIYTYEESIK